MHVLQEQIEVFVGEVVDVARAAVRCAVGSQALVHDVTFKPQVLLSALASLMRFDLFHEHGVFLVLNTAVRQCAVCSSNAQVLRAELFSSLRLPRALHRLGMIPNSRSAFRFVDHQLREPRCGIHGA